MTACSAHWSNHTEETIRGQEVAAEGYRKQSFCTDLSHSRPLFHPLSLVLLLSSSVHLHALGSQTVNILNVTNRRRQLLLKSSDWRVCIRRRAQPCFLCLSPISPAAGEPADSFVPGSRGFKPWRSRCGSNPGSCVTRIKMRPKPSFRLSETWVTTAMTWGERVPQLQQI